MWTGLIDYFVMFEWRSKNGYYMAREIFDRIVDLMPEIMRTQMDLSGRIHREDITLDYFLVMMSMM